MGSIILKQGAPELLIDFVYLVINIFKYHVSYTDGKSSVRIIYFYYLVLHRRPNHKL